LGVCECSLGDPRQQALERFVKPLVKGRPADFRNVLVDVGTKRVRLDPAAGVPAEITIARTNATTSSLRSRFTTPSSAAQRTMSSSGTTASKIRWTPLPFMSHPSR